MAACTLKLHPTESGYLLRISGRGTMRESPAVRDFVCGAMEDGVQVVLDLTPCEFLDSTFLGCLVLLQQRGETSRGGFCVIAPVDKRSQLFGKSRLDMVLKFTDEAPACYGEPVTLESPDLCRTEFGRHLLETHEKLADLGGPAAETFRAVARQLALELSEPSK